MTQTISTTIKVTDFNSISTTISSENLDEDLTFTLRKCILLTGLNHPTVERAIISGKAKDPYLKLFLQKLEQLKTEFKEDPLVKQEVARLIRIRKQYQKSSTEEFSE